jgi:hypothetical protein
MEKTYLDHESLIADIIKTLKAKLSEISPRDLKGIAVFMASDSPDKEKRSRVDSMFYVEQTHIKEVAYGILQTIDSLISHDFNQNQKDIH